MTAPSTTPPLDDREAVARTGESAWKSYAETPPKIAGTFRWRVPSRAVQGLTITFMAENRTRGAGFDTVISPSFDHWNGYSVSVPKGTEWKSTEQPEATPRQSYRCIEVEDLAAAEPCPFCKKRPTIDGDAPWMWAGPHEWREWYLRCCGMVRAPTYSDPRLAVAAWNSALSSPLRIENETLRTELAQAKAQVAGMRVALQTIAEEHDVGRHDGLPEACPAHEAEVMWAVARAAPTNQEPPMNNPNLNVVSKPDSVVHTCKATKALAMIDQNSMPNEFAALMALTRAHRRLVALGFQEVAYCPKDKIIREFVEIDSTGVHKGYRDLDGTFWLFSDGDLMPSHPFMFRDAEPPHGD